MTGDAAGRAEDIARTSDELVAFDGLIFGSPAHLGGVSGPFKSFIDSAGRFWRTQQLRGRIAVDFTLSSLPPGDQQSTLLSMFVFGMQCGMLWVGNPILPEQLRGILYDEAADPLGSWSGLMAQAGYAAHADAFVAGGVRTAHMFGRHFAGSLRRL